VNGSYVEITRLPDGETGVRDSKGPRWRDSALHIALSGIGRYLRRATPASGPYRVFVPNRR
jgi:hypothetical protein